MRLLLVHQNFPGQFRDLAPKLLDLGHELKAISCSERPIDSRVEILRYQFRKPEAQGIHGLSVEIDEWVQRGVAAAGMAQQLKERGWGPDAILAHPGWGETLFLKEVFDATPLVIWPELWLRDEHMGVRRGQRCDLGLRYYLRTKNWLLEGAMGQCDLAILPTRYQASCFPKQWQSKIRVLHEGINEQFVQLSRLNQLSLGQQLVLKPEVPVLTYASRNLEPMRGFDRFLKGLALLQQRWPAVHTLIAGAWGSSYSGTPKESGKTWRDLALEEVEGQLDLARVHFVGHLQHKELLKLFRRSDCHVYLSRSFVLSWSLLEAMACGTPLLVDQNPMLEELRDMGGDVVYTDSNNPERLATAMQQCIEQGVEARQTGRVPRRLGAPYLLDHTSQVLEGWLHMLVAGRY